MMSNEEWNKKFAKRFKRLLKERGMNQYEFADAMFMSQTTVSYYATGKRTPSAYTMLLISEVLGCDVEYLINVEGEEL